ncbi:hypothetical protein ACFWGN_11950 [Oerskovia sp. NPDC060338]|uniref:hypothetical protein n=1 Tax=Oerskovia sp. NPDC060338 TaxID=3347100 RepID=UPI0036484D21
MFIATINVPGYLPDGDQSPAVFDTAAEAWAYLAEERELALNLADMVLAEVDLAPAPGDAPDLALGELRRFANVDLPGTVYASNSLSGATHDLGMAYSVVIAEDGGL